MYEKYYEEFRNEIHKALGAYLLWKMLHNRPSSDAELLAALNKTPTSWILIRHSLQVTLFITLGRIFDADTDSLSADVLLKNCIEKIDIFSKKNLEQRKLRGQNGRPDWLDNYITNAHVPSVEDFQKLRGQLTKCREVFERMYKPIRHKLFAHKDKEYIGKSDELWAKTNIGELERIIWFLWDLQETLYNIYENGRKPILENKKPDTDFYEIDFGLLLDIVKMGARS